MLDSNLGSRGTLWYCYSFITQEHVLRLRFLPLFLFLIIELGPHYRMLWESFLFAYLNAHASGHKNPGVAVQPCSPSFRRHRQEDSEFALKLWLPFTTQSQRERLQENVLEFEHLLGSLKLLAAMTLTTLTLAHDKKKMEFEHSDQRENSVACNLRG